MANMPAINEAATSATSQGLYAPGTVGDDNPTTPTSPAKIMNAVQAPNASQTLSLIVIADLCTVLSPQRCSSHLSTVRVDRPKLEFTQGDRFWCVSRL
jgi:hypothetical protein